MREIFATYLEGHVLNKPGPVTFEASWAIFRGVSIGTMVTGLVNYVFDACDREFPE